MLRFGSHPSSVPKESFFKTELTLRGKGSSRKALYVYPTFLIEIHFLSRYFQFEHYIKDVIYIESVHKSFPLINFIDKLHLIITNCHKTLHGESLA